MFFSASDWRRGVLPMAGVCGYPADHPGVCLHESRSGIPIRGKMELGLVQDIPGTNSIHLFLSHGRRFCSVHEYFHFVPNYSVIHFDFNSAFYSIWNGGFPLMPCSGMFGRNRVGVVRAGDSSDSTSAYHSGCCRGRCCVWVNLLQCKRLWICRDSAPWTAAGLNHLQVLDVQIVTEDKL